MADPKQLLQQINEELSFEKLSVIRKLIREELANMKVDEKNLSNSVIQMIMKSQDTATRELPEKKSAPDFSSVLLKKNEVLDANIAAIIDDILVGNNVYLYGKAGTGKTFLAENVIAPMVNLTPYVINCSQWTSPIHIIGGQTITGYKQGILIEAWINGGMLLLDELPKLDPNTAGLLNDALSKTANSEKTSGRKVYITDGNGQRHEKHPNFSCIATGNTNLKTISTNFSGNNRQDYSLVDRFSGSFYEIRYNTPLEKAETYTFVYDIAAGVLREFLDNQQDAVESISLRTLLNFNRTFEQELLRKVGSPFANDLNMKGGKTFANAVWSFINTLSETMRTQLLNTTNIQEKLAQQCPDDEFIREYRQKHNADPITGKMVEAPASSN